MTFTCTADHPWRDGFNVRGQIIHPQSIHALAAPSRPARPERGLVLEERK